MSEREPVGIVPYIFSPDCKRHVEWLEKVFGGKLECIHRTEDESKIMHCSVAFNQGKVFLADASVGEAECAPLKLEDGENAKGLFCLLSLADEETASDLWKKALEQDAKPIMELGVQFWGDVYGSFRDPLGYTWALSAPHKKPAEPEIPADDKAAPASV